MSDAIGASWLPALAPSTTLTERTAIVTTRAPGDPALVTLGSYLATVLQAKLNAAWAVIDPASSLVIPQAIDGVRDGVGVVRRVYYHDPKKGDMISADLPALFVYRQAQTQPARFSRFTSDSHRRTSLIHATWVAAPVETPRQRDERDPFMNSVNGALHHALTWKKDPAWLLDSEDSDLTALHTGFATSTSPVVLTTFNGVLGSTRIRPPRPITLTTAVAVGAYSTDPITVTGLDRLGRTFNFRTALTDPNGGETVVTILRFAQPTALSLPAMVTGAGNITVGYWDSPDKRGGSLVQRACQFAAMDLREIRYQPFEVVRQKGEEPIKLLGVDAAIEVKEDQFWDPDTHAETPYTIEAHTMRADGEEYQSVEIP